MSRAHTVSQTATLQREIRKKVETGTGFHHVPDGHENADVELTADLAGLVQRLGLKAMKNKTGRASAMHGLLKVRVTRRQRVPA